MVGSTACAPTRQSWSRACSHSSDFVFDSPVIVRNTSQDGVEYLIPLFKEAGVVGVIFYDTGNVFNNGENIDLSNLRQSAGFGFRWYSPMGPMRFENGYILDPKEGESKGGKWEFSMGSAF